MHDVNNTMSMANPPGIIWQPVAPANTLKDIMGKKLNVILAFSIISIVLGILSILLQIATLVIYAEYIYYTVYYPIDVIGHGIWCGTFYVTAGSLGVAACRTPKTSLLVGTVVVSAISVAGAIVASTLSGIAASLGFYYCYKDISLCEAWEGLEWTLMSISILAFMNSITLVSLVSVPLCCSGRKKGPQGNTSVLIGVGSHQKPMYHQPQPMHLAAHQQPIYLAPSQQPNVQVVHAGQQNPQQMQYPQQLQVQFLPNSQVVYVPQPQQYSQQQQTQKAPAAKQQAQAPVVHQQQPQQNQTSPYEELNVQLHAVENT
ncbi:uncharacterized protein LOC130685854 [Daphnia carinata]|uniref:uncharacterized protein LOC130685854 n=1 Tax=Daphnia carinata TaxID=120202 RepID=UPI00257979A3|nr:uncharacterized protein LOC130685854 [Daphnia carinata]